MMLYIKIYFYDALLVEPYTLPPTLNIFISFLTICCG